MRCLLRREAVVGELEKVTPSKLCRDLRRTRRTPKGTLSTQHCISSEGGRGPFDLSIWIVPWIRYCTDFKVNRKTASYTSRFLDHHVVGLESPSVSFLSDCGKLPRFLGYTTRHMPASPNLQLPAETPLMRRNLVVPGAPVLPQSAVQLLVRYPTARWIIARQYIDTCRYDTSSGT